jgi:DNA-binding transcriptional LysR family regulator
MDRLNSMQVFVEVVDRGSLAAAARALKLTAPMVGKHVASLESRLGVRLFARTTRRQRLTDAGSAYLERCRRILREVAEADEDARGRETLARGSLRVTAGVSYGASCLAPVIARFLEQQPAIDVELILTDERVDLIDGGFDAAVRIGPLADSGLVARPLLAYQMAICAAPRYLASRGKPSTLDDLADHDCLGLTQWDRQGGWSLGRRNAPFKLPRSRFRSNSGAALREAAIAGAGIVMQPRALLASALDSGALVEILARQLRPPRPVHLLYSRKPPMRLRCFVDFVLQHLGRRTQA